MSDTPEKDKLMNTLFGDEAVKLVNFKVTWGDDAHLLTDEERYAVLNKALEGPFFEVTDIDNYDGSLAGKTTNKFPKSKVPVTNVAAYTDGITGFTTGGKNLYEPGTIEYNSFERGFEDARAKWNKDGV